MGYIGSFLLVLGFLQLVSVYFHLRGASLTGPLSGPGILFGFLLFTSGVWFVIDEPLLRIVTAILISIPLAWILLLLFGIVTNIGWDPSKEFIRSQRGADASVTEVNIGVRMTHVAQNAETADYQMPGTYFVPAKGLLGTHENGPVAVLIVCGAGDTRLAFKWRLFEEFLRRGIAVLTIDPPGHGDFQVVPITVANGRAACRGALNWLIQQPGIQSVGVVGISFGGNLLADLTATDNRVKCLATISTPIHLDNVTRQTFVGEILGLFFWPRNIGLLREGSLITLLLEYRKLKGAWFGETLIDMIDALHTTDAVRMIGARPTMFAHGTRDAAIPFTNAQNLFDAAAPDRSLLLIPQATHVSPVLFPKEMAQLVDWVVRSLDYNRNDAQQAV